MGVVVRIQRKLKLIVPPPHSKCVRLDRGAEGQHGWLGCAEALLIEAQEMGKVLVGVFIGRQPLQFRGRFLHAPNGILPETEIATTCLRCGVALNECGLYTRNFPSLPNVVFFVRAGIDRFFYADGDRPNEVIDFLNAYDIKITRVSI